MDSSAARTSFHQRVHEYGFAVVVCVVAAAALWLLPAERDPRVGLLLFCPAVALAGWRGGFGPAALATGLGPLASAGAGAADVSLFALGGLGLGAAVEAAHRQRRRERDRRLEAERRRRRAEHLHQLTTELSKAATPVEVIDACVLEATHSLEAAAGALALVSEDGRWVELAKTVGFHEEPVAAWRRVPFDLKTPISDAIRSGAPVALGSRAARRAEYADQVGSDLFDGHEAVMTMPLIGRGGAVGALALAVSDPRAWTPDERDLLLQVARRGMQALERARGYELAERARADAEDQRARADQELAELQKVEEALRDSEARYRALAARTSRLHALTAALSEAVTPDAVARAVVRHGRVVVGAQSAAVTLLVDAGGQLASLCAEDDSAQVPEAWSRFAVEPGLYSTEVIHQQAPVFIDSFADWQRRYWRSALEAADLGYASAAALPLIADGAPIGVLSFHFTAPLNFDEDYRTLLMSVAQHCAQALDRARLYEAEQRTRADAEAANQSKDDFLSTVSHELRTPLNAILGWASMLRTGSLGPGRSTRALQAIYDSATRQARLIDELLDISRIAAGRVALDLRESDLREIIRGAVEAMMPLAEAKGLELRLGHLPAVVVVADARRLEQVFLNLLSNAVKFTPAGGRVEVEVALTDTAIDICVSDTGIGVDPSFLPHAFDPFRQADSHTTRAHGGLGLGLSIARRLVEAHGGRIRVDSDGPGRGTSCIVSLPIVAPRVEETSKTPAADAVEDAGSRELPDLSRVRVLVVDDEPDAREMTTAALERCGATVVVATSAQEALALLDRTDVDVLLADIGMPGEDGYSLMRKVRALSSSRGASVPAAAVTAYAREDQREQALAAGFQVHLAKPLDVHRLAHTVVQLTRTAV